MYFFIVKDIAESTKFKDIKLHRPYQALTIDTDLSSLLDVATNQNFIPITDDRNVFIGIVKRKAIIQNYIKTKLDE